jgi:hypothetical protein
MAYLRALQVAEEAASWQMMPSWLLSTQHSLGQQNPLTLLLSRAVAHHERKQQL